VDTAVTAARVRAYEKAALSRFPDLVTDPRKAGLTRPTLINRADFARAVERAYPPRLRSAGVGGEVQVMFVVDTAGRVVDPEVLWSTDESLASAALSVIQSAQFNAATAGGRAHPVMAILPIVFSPNVERRK
jgi:TonB family protein